MATRRTVLVSTLSTFGLTLCLLSTGSSAQIHAGVGRAKPNSISSFASQKGPEVVAGAPLKGVDVKLGKNPGGSPAARTTTDTKGKFNFGVVPAGSYILTLDLPGEPNNTGASGAAAKEKGPSAVNVKLALVTVEGAVAGRIKTGWNFQSREAFLSTAQSTAKAMDQKKIILESNGRDPLSGICETAIVKSKSNITNN